MNTLEKPKTAAITNQITVLLVEDNTADARYVEETLPKDKYKLIPVTTLSQAHESISQGNIDVVLLDLSLPDSQGLETFLSMSVYVQNIPIVILTGLDDEEIAVKALKLGAQDFILKHGFGENILMRSIRYSIERSNAEKAGRQQSAKALEAAAYLKMALKASQTSVWSWEIGADKVIVDDLGLAMFGLESIHTIKRLQDFLINVHQEDRLRIKEAIYEAIKNKEEYDVGFRVTWADSSEHYISAIGRVIYDKRGTAVTMVGASRDVTKRRIEQENAKKIIILEKHEDFVATLTHDLKNPLIGADRVLELFLSGAVGVLDEKQQNLMRVLQQSNANMLALIQNLLEVYRHDAGIRPLDLTKVDVAELTNTCISQLTALAERSGIKLTSTFIEGNHTILADAVALRRVLMNLLSNGMKFTGSGGSVSVIGRSHGSTYFLEVKDTGFGMPQSDLEALFQKYSQGKLGRKYEAGTGLGLYLCRQLVEAHGGEINCTSAEGVGTTFLVTIPIIEEAK